VQIAAKKKQKIVKSSQQKFAGVETIDKTVVGSIVRGGRGGKKIGLWAIGRKKGYPQPAYGTKQGKVRTK